MDECNDLLADLSCSTSVVISRKKAKKAAPVLALRFSIALLPALFCPRLNSSSHLSRLGLDIILVIIRMDHPVTEDSCSEVGIMGLFEQRSTFWSNARSLFI